MTFAAPWRKLILTLHVISSVGFMGAVAAFLALATVGATTGDPLVARAVYIAMSVVTWYVIVPLAAASFLIGVIQSLSTPWGLFRYYWVIIKLVLTLLVAVVLALQTSTINALASAALGGDLTGLGGARFSVILHGTGGLAVLTIATVLSVYKPRGMTRYGAAKIA